MSLKTVIILIISISILKTSKELSVALNYRNEYCVYDLFYQDTVIILNYEFDLNTLNQHELKKVKTNFIEWTLDLEDTSKDPNKLKKGEQIEFKRTTNTKKTTGKIAHTIEASDNYKICVRLTNNKLIKRSVLPKLKLRIETSLDEMDQEEQSAKMKDYKMVSEKTKNLLKKVDVINSVQKYQNSLEQEFSKSQIDSNRLIATLSVVQIIIICIIGGFHIVSLRGIVKNKV